MKKKILLIEDEFYISDLYKMMLESANFEVILGHDGEEGLELAQGLPDLILLDIMLPKMNGIIVLKTLKSNPRTKNIPVVLLTNLGQESIIKAAFNLGACGCLLKVRLEPKDLSTKVMYFLDHPGFRMNPDTLVLD